jgi:hypothetical protein
MTPASGAGSWSDCPWPRAVGAVEIGSAEPVVVHDAFTAAETAPARRERQGQKYAGLSDGLFWWSLPLSLVIAFVITVPVTLGVVVTSGAC